MNIKTIQNSGLEILKDVANVFEKNNIRYFLAYGTQLGASRHHDVIPWDYDFDMGCMLVDFIKIKEALSSLTSYNVVYNQTTKGNKTLASIMVISKDKSKFYREENAGMYLDIFLFDHAPKQTKLVKICYKCNYFQYSMERKVKYFGFNNLYKVLRLENFNVVKALMFIIAFGIIKLLSPLLNWYLKNKKQNDIYSYSTSANAFGLDVEKFVYPSELINSKLVKTAQIGENKFNEFENVEQYLNLAFGKKWQTPINEKQIKHQILTKFPKVITSREECE